MAQLKVTNLQYPMAFSTVMTFEDLGDDIIIDVPPGFILLDAGIAVRTAFDGTTPTVEVTDNKESPTTIVASAAATAGNKTMAAAAKYSYYPSGGQIIARFAVASGTPTAGLGHLVVEGIALGRQNERVGTLAAT